MTGAPDPRALARDAAHRHLVAKLHDQGKTPREIAAILAIDLRRVTVIMADILTPEPVVLPDGQVAVVAPGKVCPNCGRLLLLAMFAGRSGKRAGQLNGWCRPCDATRVKNDAPTRLVRNRARQRATQKLVELHRGEFRDLLDTELAYAEAEAAGLKVASTAAGVDHGDAPRLRPGPKLDGIEDGPRLDLNWCQRCTTFHDLGHHVLSTG